MSEYDEIFDVVDSEDMVIGKASRHQVHNNDLMHRFGFIFLFLTLLVACFFRRGR